MSEYTKADLEQHIQCLWLSEYVLTVGEKPEIKSRASPGHQPDLPVIVADIRRAWERAGLDSLEREVLELWHFWDGDALRTYKVAAIAGIATDEVAAILEAATERLLNFLNGVTAYG